MKNNKEWQEAKFIDNRLIEEKLKLGKEAKKEELLAVIEKAKEAKGLSIDEIAKLLQCDDQEIMQKMFLAAGEIKRKIYGKRVVMFAPLYISDYCINDCTYCGYCSSQNFKRKKLNREELIEEVKALESMGHKRLAVEAGEHPLECPIEYVLESLKTIYEVKEDKGAIRRCNVNIAATTVENYRKLKDAGIGTYILFQETYHRQTYQNVHPKGPKADYDWHIMAHHRAMQAGIDDVGFGVLFGLYDYRFEVLSLFLHSEALEKDCGVGPHTISVPRLRQAKGMDLKQFPFLVSDDEFMKIVAIIRLAVPYTGIILSTRETAKMRHELLKYGVSQISAGSCTGVGGYSYEKKLKQNLLREGEEAAVQFYVDDHRDTNEVLQDLCKYGWLPSFCTACYRQGRTGDRFMALAKSGEIQNVCQPNAILTLQEFLLDYASDDLKKEGKQVIEENIKEIKDEQVREKTVQELKKMQNGVRDLFF